jgi:hypothetical protein
MACNSRIVPNLHFDVLRILKTSKFLSGFELNDWNVVKRWNDLNGWNRNGQGEWVVVVELLNLELNRKTLNGAKRLNGWNDWNGPQP